MYSRMAAGEAEILSVAVAPARRGKGLARVLLNHHLRRLAGLGIHAVFLEVGKDNYPFPVPLVKQGDRWYFDTEAGKDELLTRRIGRNELDTLEIVRTYVDAQREYASRDRDGDQVLQ